MLEFAKYLNYFYTLRQNFASFISEILLYWHIRIYLAVLLSLNLLNWLTVFYIDRKITDQQIALHFNVDFGVDYYGDISNLYIIPSLGLFFIVFNFFLLGIINTQPDRKFVSHLLLSSVAIANLLLFISLISIFLVNY